MEQEFIPKRAMTIHAHPDDQEFTIAGTLAKWAKAGCEIVAVVITSGDSGSNDPSRGPEYKTVLAEMREAEQRAANAVLGVREAIFLRYPDGELEPTVPLRKELTRLIRKHKPEAVVCGNPDGWFYGSDYVNHPDHRAAAEAAVAAVFPSAGSRLIFADLLGAGFEPHEVKRLYIHGVDTPDTWVDISAELDLKLEALRKHSSQLSEDPAKMITEWAAEEGKSKGIAYAETYKVMVLVKDEQAK